MEHADIFDVRHMLEYVCSLYLGHIPVCDHSICSLHVFLRFRRMYVVNGRILSVDDYASGLSIKLLILFSRMTQLKLARKALFNGAK